jgi:hypothetical protein
MLSLLGGFLGVAIVIGYARFNEFDAIMPWFWLSVGVAAALSSGPLLASTRRGVLANSIRQKPCALRREQTLSLLNDWMKEGTGAIPLATAAPAQWHPVVRVPQPLGCGSLEPSTAGSG